ncbi:hypothetical protein [Nocardia callitridis]|uniref:Heavy metal-binding domain-containing protein n=1 Tax=Nocardia callitridis TaxID=648753 RepID=A0ABP9JSC3_9NOCA
MRDRLRFLAFGGALVVLFGVALGIGTLVGDHGERAPDTAMPSMGDAHHGLAQSESGYTLADLTAPSAPNQLGRMQFRITGPGGEPVTRFDTLHDKQLHLIVVRTDTTEFRHVHPTMDAEGTWSLDWTWAQPGTYRVYADFAPDSVTENPGELVLSRTVEVAGTATPQPIPAPSRTATVDGYQVSLVGDLSTAGSELTFTVSRDGAPVTDLSPYLGAYAHLVALRVDDLAYLHVHPEGAVGSTPAGPEVAFHAQAPGPAAYRLYLDFSHGGTVHTAEFTAHAESPAVRQSSGRHQHEG